MKKSDIKGYLFILPWLIGLCAFVIFPMVFSLCISLTDWPILSAPKFIFLDNYIKIFKDPIFYQSLFVTLKYVLYTILPTLAISLLIAVLLNSNIKFQGFFRTIFYLPAVLPTVAVALVWSFFYNKDYGLLNNVLRQLGVQGPAWLADPKYALLSISIMSIWSLCCTNIIIYLAGLQGVPRSYYEASLIDGASPLKQFWKITLPLMSPAIFYTVIMSVILSFQVFTSALILTNGGPIDSTRFYVLYLYDNAFRYYKMGYASALGWVLFFIILVFNFVIFKSSSKWVYYEVESK